MTDDEIKYIQDLLDLVPKSPWYFSPGDDFDHWEIWSSDKETGCSMVQDDSDVPPDDAFIEFVLRSREIIERLLKEVKKEG